MILLSSAKFLKESPRCLTTWKLKVSQTNTVINEQKLTPSIFINSVNAVEFGPRVLAHQAISHSILDKKGKNGFSALLTS